MIEKKINSTRYFQFSNLSELKGLLHFVSSRDSGNMAFTGHVAEETKTNIVKLLSMFDIPIENAVFGHQIHSENISLIDEKTTYLDTETGLNIVPDTDALITSTIDKCIIVKTADCSPVVLFDPAKKAVGVVHSGWKGLLNHIVEKTVRKMMESFDSKLQDIIAGIGPSLGPEDFYIREDVSSLFEKDGINSENLKKVSEDQWLLNAWGVIRDQLIQSGLEEKNIEIAGISTLNSEDFYSHRMKHPKGHFITGAMIL